jgi:hypothetical protein
MIDQLNQAIQAYRKKWEALLAERADQAFFGALRPISVGWKVADVQELDAAYQELRSLCDQTHAINKNDRWLTTLHLKDTQLPWGIEVINLMQRRPNSQDTLGLDNINFLTDHFLAADEVLTKEPDLKWTHESNGPYSQWISVWFADTEAKIRPISVLDVSLAEFKEVRDKVLTKTK